MVTYLYGLVLARNARYVPAHITGIAGSTVRMLPCDGLDAIVSTLEKAPARASIDDLKAHDHALQSIVHHGSTTAAVRFGQAFESDADARRHVNERAARVERVLEEYDGCVEMRLLLPVAFDAAVEPIRPAPELGLGPGRAYLETLRAADSKQPVDDLALRAALGPVVRAERVEELPKSRGVAFSHLINRDEETIYRQAVTALPALAEARVVGPLPFYSFAEPSQ